VAMLAILSNLGVWWESHFGDEFKKTTMVLRKQVSKEQSLVSCDLSSLCVVLRIVTKGCVYET
jgi:hypothetical protein